MAYNYSGITPDTDSGVKGDSITNIDPVFYGTGDAGSTVYLYSYDNQTGYSLVGSSPVDNNGNWTVSANPALPEGNDGFYIQQYNPSTGYSGGMQYVTIDKTAAAPLNLTLTAQSDSGVEGDNITNVTTPGFSGTAEANSMVTLQDGMQILGQVQADTNGNWTFNDATVLADGTHYIYASQTDAAGNTSGYSDPLQIVVDTTAPAMPTDISLTPQTDSGIVGDQITSNSGPTITGSTDGGNTVNVFIGGNIIGSTTADSSGNWQYSLDPLEDGTYSIQVESIDTAGNISPSSNAFELTVDTTAPTAVAPTLSASRDSGVSGDNITSYNQPSFYGTAAVGDSVSISDGTTVTQLSVNSSGQWNYFVPSPLADGVYNYTTTETDAAGNVSAPSQALQLTIDTTAPIASAPALDASTDTGVVGDNITSNNQPTFYGTATTPGDKISISNGTTTVPVAVNSNGEWNYFTPSPLADGVYNYTITETDRAGNVSAPSQALQLTIDTTAPAVATFGLSPNSDTNVVGDNITNNNLPSLSGKAEAGSAVSVQINGNVYGTAVTDQSGNWTVTPGDMPVLADDSYLVTASSTDAAGNTNNQGSTLITIDTTPPAIPAIPMLTSATDSGVKGDNITSNSQPTISGTAEANTTVFLLDPANEVFYGTVQSDSSGNWSFSFPSVLADGNYSVAVGNQDVAGNFSNLSQTYNFTVDTVAPTTVIGTFLESSTDSGLKGDNVTNNNLPSLAGATEPMSTVTISGIGDNTYSTQADASGKWEYNFTTPVADGSYAIQVMATDIAGNTSTLTSGFTLTVDTTAPTASVAALSAANNGMLAASGTSNNPQPTFVGQAEVGSVVTVSVLSGNNTVESANVNTDATGNWSYTAVNNLSSGSYQLSTVVSDAATNMSANNVTSFTIDTTIPAATNVTTTTSSSSNVYAGDTVTFNVSSDKALVVNTTNGSPQLTLNSGAPATYQGTTADGKTLIFSTQIAQGQLSNNLKVTGVDLNGSKITDQAGNTASLSNVGSAEGSATNIVVGDPVSTGAAGDIFRFFNTGDGSHFYTLSTTEKAQVLATRPDLTYEGTSFRSVDATDPNATNVYRFFDKNDGSHFFTTSVEERDQTIQNRSDLTYEGTNFYEHATQQAGDVAVYRFFNTQNGSHLFTSDANEIKATAALPDYKVEGIAFYTSNPNG